MKNSIKILLVLFLSIYFSKSVYCVDNSYRNIKFDDKISHSILKKVDGKYKEFNYNFEIIEKSIFKSSLSLKEVSDNLIYPNPADNSINFKIKLESIASKVNFYNLIGNLEATYMFHTQIDIQGLSKGFYIVNVTDKQDRIIFRSKLIIR